MGTIANHAGLKPVPLTVDSFGVPLPATASGTFGGRGSYAWDRVTAANALDLVETYSTYGLQVNLSSSAAPSAFSAQLQGSLDGISFYNLGAALTSTASGAQYVAVVDSPARYLRVVLSITGGTGVQATAWVGVSE